MPKIVDPETRRAQFVEASWSLIAREGIGAATLRRVSAEAGFTMGALTHYFSDRDALLAESLRATHFAAGARMLAAAAAAATPRERCKAILLEALPLDTVRLREWRVWLAYWGEAIARPALMAENTRRYEEWTDLVETVLTSWTGAGRPQATSIIARIDGFGMQITLAGHDPERLAEIRRAAIEDLELILRELEERVR
jgi:DNA-binding transcriptional regulator YbjK